MNLKIKISNERDINIEISDSGKVLDIKNAINKKSSDIEISVMKLIYRGKILKDDQNVTDQYIEDGVAIHCVVSKIPVNSQQSSINVSEGMDINDSSNPWAIPAPQTQSIPPGMLDGMPFGMQDSVPSNMLDGMNFTTIQSMMTNPMFQSIMDSIMTDPEQMTKIIDLSRRVNTGELSYANAISDPAYRDIASSPQFQEIMQQFISGSFGAGEASIQSIPEEDYREVYENQLETLKEFGFTDEERNILILRGCQGDVTVAMNILLDSRISR